MHRSVIAEEFSTLEERAEQGVYRDWVEAGRALGEIRRRRLYRAHYSSFGEYARDRFDLARSTANELIAAADVAGDLSAHADIRLPQRHCHILYRFRDPETRVAVAQQIAGLTIREATALVLSLAVPEFRLPTGALPPPRHARQAARAAWDLARKLQKLNPPAVALGITSFSDAEQRKAADDLRKAAAMLEETVTSLQG